MSLRGVRPPVWRRIRVAGDFTHRELHHVLQIAFGWTDSHLHEFDIGGKRYGMPDPREDISGAPKAECLAGGRACPPEDSGGAHRYEELIEAVADPTNKRHRELLDWVGPHFDPEEFDLVSVNRPLRGAGAPVGWEEVRIVGK